MKGYKAFRECISDKNNELIIYAADNFSQFTQRDSSVHSRCDRTLAAATANDMVVLRTKLDYEYHRWMRSVGLGTDLVVEYGASAEGLTLSELIILNPDPIIEIIQKTGRKPVYVPWFSTATENEAAKILGADLFGAPESETLKYNDKASFKNICQQLNIPVIEGVSFQMKPGEKGNYPQMKRIIKGFLQRYSTVILRGALGISGMSLYKTKGDDISGLYQEIADSGEQLIIIEPFLNVASSPNDQWIISRNGNINNLGTGDQICKNGLIHTGTMSTVQHSVDVSKYIKETSFKIVSEMAKTGYIGVVGIDYIVTDEGVFPIENNARFNGSSYSMLIVDRIEKMMGKIPFWKFSKIKTAACSFEELKVRLDSVLYDGVKNHSIFPFNSEDLADTGSISFILLAEYPHQISKLEQVVKDLEVDSVAVLSK